MKRFIITLVSVLLLLSVAGPYVVLMLAEQETPADNYAYSDSF